MIRDLRHQRNDKVGVSDFLDHLVEAHTPSFNHPALVQHASDPRVPRHRLVRRGEQVRGESEVEQAWRCDLDAIMDGTPTGEFQDKPAARSSATSR